jgi:hypothetical protein
LEKLPGAPGEVAACTVSWGCCLECQREVVDPLGATRLDGGRAQVHEALHQAARGAIDGRLIRQPSIIEATHARADDRQA